METLACTHAGVWPVNTGACPICYAALREENARLKDKIREAGKEPTR